MEEPDILDHFREESGPDRPAIGILVLLGILLGVPAGVVYYIFFMMLPPPGDFGWLKGMVLFGNQGIFMIMILSYLAHGLQLRTVPRQFSLGMGFVAGSVLTLPVLILRRIHPDFWNILRAILRPDTFPGWYLLIAFVISSALLIFLIYRYGTSFSRRVE